MTNKYLEIGKKIWNQMPDVGKKIVMVVSLFLLGTRFPWQTLGEIGTYIKAGLTLGSIFLALKLFGGSEEKGKKKDKKKKDKKTDKIAKLKQQIKENKEQIRINEEKMKKIKKARKQKKLKSLCNEVEESG